MTGNRPFCVHAVLQTALFVLGSAVISRPARGADEFTFSGLLISFAAAVLLYALMLPLSKAAVLRSEGENTAVSGAALCLLFFGAALFSLWCAADAFIAFTRFASEIMLPDSPAVFSVLLFLSAVIFFTLKRQEHILKFFFTAFWGVLFVALLFFITMLSSFDPENIFIYDFFNVKGFAAASKPYLINPVLPLALLPVYNSAVLKKTRFKAGFAGIILGYFLLFLTVSGSVLLFGAPLAGELDYPYSFAVSTVSVGRLFSRLDGLSYYLYFICALCRVSVCLFTLKFCLKKANAAAKGFTRKSKPRG